MVSNDIISPIIKINFEKAILCTDDFTAYKPFKKNNEKSYCKSRQKTVCVYFSQQNLIAI